MEQESMIFATILPQGFYKYWKRITQHSYLDTVGIFLDDFMIKLVVGILIGQRHISMLAYERQLQNKIFVL